MMKCPTNSCEGTIKEVEGNEPVSGVTWKTYFCSKNCGFCASEKEMEAINKNVKEA